MDVKSPHTNKKKEDGLYDKPNAHRSVVLSDNSIIESVTQTTSFSEQTSTEDLQISLTNNSVDVFPNKASEKDQPKPSGPLLPPSVEVGTVHEANRSLRLNSRSQESIKTMTIYSESQSEGYRVPGPRYGNFSDALPLIQTASKETHPDENHWESFIC
ncbi:myoD family inhibitor domain-containing protein 2-like [Xyrichtys novacula]|uniref:MyoD family inhibitor domain-containing protein 2-like n=1 Tax=Xyrichtys novacula TaxID=13765 RepID=A0AAV1ERQ3_XYRNO|nr:myoD family inhibitor domain-containing protein 2-like [Xyrichtys novacula]